MKNVYKMPKQIRQRNYAIKCNFFLAQSRIRSINSGDRATRKWESRDSQRRLWSVWLLLIWVTLTELIRKC